MDASPATAVAAAQSLLAAKRFKKVDGATALIWKLLMVADEALPEAQRPPPADRDRSRASADGDGKHGIADHQPR